MMQLEVTRRNRTFVAFADDQDMGEPRSDDEPSKAEAVAKAAVDFYGADGAEGVSVQIINEDFDSHGISGSTEDGDELTDGDFKAQVYNETWYLFIKDGEQDGVTFFSSPYLSDWPASETNPAQAWNPVSEAEIQAGVDAGYQIVADQIAVGRVLDKDDLARIATALQLAWDNANSGSHKNRDRDVRSVLKGMAGAYSETLEKVERLLDR